MNIERIPPTKIHFSSSDRELILGRIDECLKSGQVAPGRYVEEFERNFARYVGSTHAVAVSNGGSALEVTLRALDVQGKEVVVPTNTFYATPAAVLAAGANVRLVDIDPETMAPSLEQLENAIGTATAGIISVHIGGFVTPAMGQIRELCKRRGLWLLEDCAHAHGSTLGDAPAGSFGIAAAYSFCSTKIITSGEGGMVTTNDDALARTIRLMRNYGKPEPWVTYSVRFGMNWRLNEIAAIIGLSQLQRLDEFIAWRQEICTTYSRALSVLNDFAPISAHGRSSCYKYIVVLPSRLNRAAFRAHMADRGIRLPGGVYDVPLHRQPIASGLLAAEPFPGADLFCDRHICLPVYFGMTAEECGYVADAFTAAWRGR